MKRYALIILAIIASTSAVAKVTEADVARDRAWAASQNPSVPQSVIDKQWRDYNKPPNEVGQNETRHYVEFNYGLSSGKYIGRYIQCSFSGFTQPHSGEALFEKRIYKSGNADSNHRYQWYVTNKSEKSNHTVQVMCY